MVMVKLDHTVIAMINGKQKGARWRYDRCGQHLESYNKSTRKRTKYQGVIRDYYTQCLNVWKRWPSDMTRQERQSWTVYGIQHPVPNKKGELRKLSGYSAFLSINIQRLEDGKQITYEAPLPTEPPPPPMLSPPTARVIYYDYLTTIIEFTFPHPMATADEYMPDYNDIQIWFGWKAAMKHSHLAKIPSTHVWLDNQHLRIQTWGWLVWTPKIIHYTRGETPFTSVLNMYKQRTFEIEITQLP